MSSTEFLSSAKLIAKRNLTDNVRAVSASFADQHLSVTYYVASEPTIGDEEERELTVAELIAAFPEVKTADAYSEISTGNVIPLRGEHIVFQR